MVKNVAHIGFTVSNLDQSIKFYNDILKFHFVGKIKMQGKETDEIFQRDNASAEIAYFSVDNSENGPLIELIQFVNFEICKKPTSLFETSISELCFTVDDIDAFYKYLIDNNVVVLSEPKYFDYTEYGFSKSRALYFRDPDGIILEAIEYF